ncbi:hypothetical protein [Lentzea cavernae]|uniref:Uncharacterized protein n=1 Tax=Lentzea cavernae TaxID=2020703 RepID=A0ABQ3MTY9_9PSEU|nr:hypothetical protein [Lentzea cavernae]GHH58621.1 hypothetical protein GCM10017774_80280 [Lentzea cavernae]
MLLAEFFERAGLAGVVSLVKMDGPRPRNKWTVHLSKPPYVGEYWMSGGDFTTLDRGLASARRALGELPGDWSWLDEPISDADAYAELFEAVGETGELFIVQYSAESKWVSYAGGAQRSCATLDECVENGLAELGW